MWATTAADADACRAGDLADARGDVGADDPARCRVGEPCTFNNCNVESRTGPVLGAVDARGAGHDVYLSLLFERQSLRRQASNCAALGSLDDNDALSRWGEESYIFGWRV